MLHFAWTFLLTIVMTFGLSPFTKALEVMSVNQLWVILLATGRTGLITDVEFLALPKAAFQIATGKNKNPIARMFGDWRNHDSAKLRQRCSRHHGWGPVQYLRPPRRKA